MIRSVQLLINKIFNDIRENHNQDEIYKTETSELYRRKNKPIPLNYNDANRNEKQMQKAIDLKTQLSDRKPKIYDLNSPMLNKNKNFKSKYISPDKNKDYSQMYQSHNTPFLYSQEQLQSFNKAASLNSSSFIPDQKQEILNSSGAPSNHQARKKKSKQNSKPNNTKTNGNSQSLAEKYEKELMKAKTHRPDTQKQLDQRKNSRKRNISNNSGRSKPPYGLRKQIEELTSKDQSRYKSVDPSAEGRNNKLNSERLKSGQSYKIKVTDNFKNFVPTTSDDFKMIINNEHKRHSSRFALRKYEDEMINRLMNHKQLIENKKEILKAEVNNSKEQEAWNMSKMQKSMFSNQQFNSKSFNDIQTEHELIKKSRLMELVNNRQQEEISSCK